MSRPHSLLPSWLYFTFSFRSLSNTLYFHSPYWNQQICLGNMGSVFLCMRAGMFLYWPLFILCTTSDMDSHEEILSHLGIDLSSQIFKIRHNLCDSFTTNYIREIYKFAFFGIYIGLVSTLILPFHIWHDWKIQLRIITVNLSPFISAGPAPLKFFKKKKQKKIYQGDQLYTIIFL